jgi:hypothetical protein
MLHKMLDNPEMSNLNIILFVILVGLFGVGWIALIGGGGDCYYVQRLLDHTFNYK